MKKGRIIKLIGGIYTVRDESNKTYELKPLGVFRYKKISPKVGDFVSFDETTILDVEERFNDLVRPAICNIDQALLISSSKRPDFSSILLDKFLALVTFNHIEPIIVITKIDLLTDFERSSLEQYLSYYKKYFRVIFFSTKTKEGLDEILEVIKDKVNVLTGQTGAGKSSLLNTIDPSLNLATDEISLALGRGKHTTRHVELIPFGDGLIADTPGFSKLEFIDMDEVGLKDSFPDFFELGSECKYHGCLHEKEPGCAVKEAVKNNTVPQERYDNYLKLREEIKQIKKKY
ncbi:MAG: ribosome small subunit-dependent GTPase A [Candidatus Izemoplasmatales bacterium]